MDSSKLSLLACLVILLIARIKAYCSDTTYAPNSTFQTNVNRLLSSLSSNANQSDGFYNTTVGENSDAVHGLFQCDGYTTVPACQKCVSDGIKTILQRCPNNTGAVDWFDNCWLHYSDEYFFSTMQEQPQQILVNTGNATDTTSFMKLLGETLTVVAKEASEGRSKKFATKEV
ncbi:putative cysteine-rich receptor-like protein kinase 9 [Prosopis cineraria]|uniref:putative cysteine-rich receptor-like protein kinase 9 n=1 Tax=Prosopis cineraria TaxID=364024 RepID=UPI00240EBD75|nr:putative cysteine-rich receptor-like protein kinase 9 [Prosopis cineraria]